MEGKKEPTHGLNLTLVWKRVASASSHRSHQSLRSTGLIFSPFSPLRVASTFFFVLPPMMTPSPFGDGGKVWGRRKVTGPVGWVDLNYKTAME
jgi:hypothetical protein